MFFFIRVSPVLWFFEWNQWFSFHLTDSFKPTIWFNENNQTSHRLSEISIWTQTFLIKSSRDKMIWAALHNNFMVLYYTSSKEFNENKPEDNIFETCWTCNKPSGFSIRVSPHFWVLSQWFLIFLTDSFIQSILLNENNQMLQPLQFFAFSLSVQQESCKVFVSQSLIGYYSSFFL